MSEQKPQIIPVQYISYCEEDEINLKEIIKTLLNYKYFIIVFTLLITVGAIFYTFIKKPIYMAKTTIQLGHINILTDTNLITLYPLDPKATTIYIKTNYKNVNTQIIKNSKNLLSISTYDTSNQKAIQKIFNIINDLKTKENKKIKSYIYDIKNQIDILKTEESSIKKQINKLNNILSNTKDPTIYQSILTALQKYQDKLLKINLIINKLQERISPINISAIKIISKITTSNSPVKPKKKLIIIVAFITGFILSIFLVFLMEFIKGFKEE